MPPRPELALGVAGAGLAAVACAWSRLLQFTLWWPYVTFLLACGWLAYASGGPAVARQTALGLRTPESAVGREWAGAALAFSLASVALGRFPINLKNLLHGPEVGSFAGVVLAVALPLHLAGRAAARAGLADAAGRAPAALLLGVAAGCAAATGALVLHLPVPEIAQAGAALMAAAGCALGALRSGAAALLVALLWILFGGALMFVPGATGKEIDSLDNLDTYLMAETKGTWLRGRIYLVDGTTREVETPWPPTVTADGLSCTVQTDAGPDEIPIASVQPKPGTDGIELRFDRVDWRTDAVWGPLGRVDAFHWPYGMHGFALFGLGPGAPSDAGIPRQKALSVDGHAYGSIVRNGGGPLFPPGTPTVDRARSALSFVDHLLSGLAYAFGPPRQALLLHTGGGLEVLAARYHGAARTVALEPQEALAALVRTRFAAFGGDLFDPATRADVDLVTAQAREYLVRTTERFDLIAAPSPETLTGSVTAPYHFLENDLYTVEGVATALRRLTSGGLVALGAYLDPAVQPDGSERPIASARLFATGLAALRRIGVGDGALADAAFMASANERCLLLLRPAGFAAADADRLVAHCVGRGFRVLYGTSQRNPATVHLQRVPGDNPFTVPFTPSAPGHDLAPATDDRPWFPLSRSVLSSGPLYDRTRMCHVHLLAWAALALALIVVAAARPVLPPRPGEVGPSGTAPFLLGVAAVWAGWFLPQRLAWFAGDARLDSGLLVPAFAAAAAFGAWRPPAGNRALLVATAATALLFWVALPFLRGAPPVLRLGLALLCVLPAGVTLGGAAAAARRDAPASSPGRARAAGMLGLGAAVGVPLGLLLILGAGFAVLATAVPLVAAAALRAQRRVSG